MAVHAPTAERRYPLLDGGKLTQIVVKNNTTALHPTLYYRLNLKFTPARRRFSVKPTLTLNGVPTGQTAWFTVNGQVPLTAPLPRFT